MILTLLSDPQIFKEMLYYHTFERGVMPLLDIRMLLFDISMDSVLFVCPAALILYAVLR